jgi:hypothetical protein
LTRDPLDDLGIPEFEAQHPDLGQLFSDLASPPVDSELAGQQAALSMFRAVRAEQAAATAQATAMRTDPAIAAQTRILGPATGKPTRRPAGSNRARRTSAKPGSSVKKARVGGRLVAFALVLAFAGSFAAAGYAAALPASLQRVAHQILGFAGVPDSPDRQPQGTPTSPATSRPVGHHSPASSPSSPTSPRPSRHNSPKPKHKSHSPSPHPSSPGRSTGPVQIAIAASQQEITAGQSVQITASLTKHSQLATGIKVTLLELAASPSGQKGGPGGPGAPDRRGWQVVGKTVTDSHGQATFPVSDLTTNAIFRIAGPGGAVSQRLAVVVVPPITATLESGPHPKLDLLVASSPLAQRGDIVELEADKNGQWRVARVRHLHENGQAVFNVPLRKISVTYRVVLLATRVHAESESSPVPAPARPHHAKQLPH